MKRVWFGDGREAPSLAEALDLNIGKGSVIALVGGGGKTSTAYLLARELEESGLRTVVTTTTHMGRPLTFPLAETVEEARVKLAEGPVMAAVRIGDSEHKFGGFPPDDFRALREAADVVLVEADGAKRLPMKASAEWEPVIPEGCTAVIAVAGIDALGKPLKETCHRSALAAGILDKNEEDPVGIGDLTCLLLSEGGQRKGVGDIPYRVLINKCDTEERLVRAGELAGRLADAGVTAACAALRDRVALVLLAAGLSRRFGENKLIYPVNGVPMYRHMLDITAEIDFAERILVTRPEQEEFCREARAEGFSIYFNPAPERGIASSVAIGVGQIRESRAVLISVCDQPCLTAESLEKLIDGYQYSGRSIAAARCGENNGNPNIFSERWFDALRGIAGDAGGKTLMKKNPGEVFFVDLPEGELEDVDVKE